MAGIKISALPIILAPALTDIYPAVQAGVTGQESLQQVLTLFEANIVITNANFSGVLALNHGGTNAALTAANGAVPYSTATAFALLANPAAAGKVFQSGNAAAPTWSTPTYPSASGTLGKILISDGTNNVYSTPTFANAYAVSTILYASASNTVTGLPTANSATMFTNSTGIPAWTSSMTNGQILIGSTGASPVLANISAGSGISISAGAGTITISGTGSGTGWTEVTGTTQAMVADNGYVANNAGTVTLTLPTTAAFGTYLAVVGKGAGGWAVAQAAGQSIRIGSVASTVGVGGSIASTNLGDSIELVCTTANTIWTALGGGQSAGFTIV